MTEFVTDEEQVERIKKWWKENGSSVLVGLVIGIGGLAGWRYWVDYQTMQAGEASAHFGDAMEALSQGSHDQAIGHANRVIDDYGSTAYAELSRLALAKAFVEQGQFDQAAQQLQMLIDATSETALEMIARKRLAAIQMQLGAADEAMQTLSVDYPQPFTAAFEELKGDILAQTGDVEAARSAYQKARLANPGVANPQYLQQKLDDLGFSAANS